MLGVELPIEHRIAFLVILSKRKFSSLYLSHLQIDRCIRLGIALQDLWFQVRSSEILRH